MRKKLKTLLFLGGVLIAFNFPFPNLILSSIAAEVTIVWNPNFESDLDGYSVYQRAGAKGPPYEWVDDIFLDELADPDHPEIILTQLKEDINYYMVVTAYDKAGNESGFSNEICFKIENSSILDCTTKSISGSDSNGGGGSGCMISTLADGFHR